MSSVSFYKFWSLSSAIFKFISVFKLSFQNFLVVAQDQKNAEASKRAETIRQLKSDLHQIEQFAEESARRVKSEIEKVNPNQSILNIGCANSYNYTYTVCIFFTCEMKIVI
jgi:cell division protein FtsB